MVLLQNGYTPPGDPFAPGGVFSLATPERNHELAAAAGFTDVTVEELTGTMRFESPDDYWTFNTAVAGPVAELSPHSTASNSVPSASRSTHRWRPSSVTADWNSPGSASPPASREAPGVSTSGVPQRSG
ncbi:MAG: hypothetical protein ACRDZS_13580 [Acidimicrobiales bacterium]